MKKSTLKKIVWRVEQDGDHRLVLTNNCNASYYEYCVCSEEDYLLDPVNVAARALNRQAVDAATSKSFAVWRLKARDKDGNLLSMCEFTIGHKAKELRESMLDEATYLAGYLIRRGIREAQDGPHLDAQREREPRLQWQFIPML